MSLTTYEDLAESLSQEIKREIAERYFIHRKVIEEDLEAYLQELEAFGQEEERVLRELLRLILMLRDPDLLEAFEKETGLSLRPFYDEYLLDSPNIQRRLFRKLKSKGLTSKRKFLHLFEDTYKRLYQKAFEYRKKSQELRLEAERIQKDIEDFQKQYDLGSIFSFFEALDSSGVSLGGIEEKDKVLEELGARLAFPKVPYPEEKFLVLEKLPPWKEVGSALRRLAKEAFQRHRGEAQKILEDLAS